ncbi:MAG: ABC-2 family transporter protein, partial [bacterium]|nr:ABC-2 family transporter protein [bacterium]
MEGKVVRFVKEQLRVNILSAMEYRVSFLSQVLFMFLNDVLLLFFWWILFSKFDSVAGWQMKEVFLLYAMSAGAYGLAYAVAGNANRLSTIIAEGQLDYYLVLPKDVWLNVLISKSMISAVGDILFAVVLFIFVLGFSAKLLVALLCLIFASIILISFTTIVHSLTFFLGNAEQIASVLTEAMLS